MTPTRRFVLIALWICTVASLPTLANEYPIAHLEGYRCDVVRVGGKLPGVPESVILVCQIDDEPNPVARARAEVSRSRNLVHSIEDSDQLRSTADHSPHVFPK